MTSAPGPPRVEVALAIPVRGDAVLVARRAPDQHLGGLWEFPGGKIRSGEDPSDAARRELREETGLDGGRIEPLVVVVHDYPDRSVRLHAFLIYDPDGAVSIDRRAWTWASSDRLAALEMPPANAAVLRALHWRFP
ncbi:MAG: (deoxy)nucleoside triphosphate pyrophosphohydrolase [Acidobacteriota bacterium]|nr:(deoxy)nucleoside triphosphate pyrophosphohydrolase [Acidobacteriota bacterium]